MPYKWNENCIEDTYVKYHCCECDKEFIVGEENADGIKLCCPYCKCENVEVYAQMSDEFIEDNGGLGCMGIYIETDTNKLMYGDIEKLVKAGIDINVIAEKYSLEHCIQDIGMANESCHENADCSDCWNNCLKKCFS